MPFTATTDWHDYENIQSDIFDHILASIELFELSVYQSPSSQDIKKALIIMKVVAAILIYNKKVLAFKRPASEIIKYFFKV